MKETIWKYLLAGLTVAGALSGCGNLKYIALKGTSIPNPPAEPIAIFIREFPVKSKASLVDPTAAVSSPYDPGSRSTATTTSGLVANTRDIEITRSSRIEDLVGAVLRELRRDRLRVFYDLEAVNDLENVREIDNPFKLAVAEETGIELEISGNALIRSRRISKKFTQKTDGVEIILTIKDVKTGAVLEKGPLKVGVHMIFNSVELEEAMAIAVVTYLTQRTPF